MEASACVFELRCFPCQPRGTHLICFTRTLCTTRTTRAVRDLRSKLPSRVWERVGVRHHFWCQTPRFSRSEQDIPASNSESKVKSSTQGDSKLSSYKSQLLALKPAPPAGSPQFGIFLLQVIQHYHSELLQCFDCAASVPPRLEPQP